MLEMKGINYISTPRPGKKRGGGAAIAANPNHFTLTKIHIHIPRGVEAVWGILKPLSPTSKFNSVIVCCFYSPPNLKKNPFLIDHITKNLQELLTSHQSAGVLILGDRNEIEIAALQSIDPSLKQIVKKPTRGNRILDVIMTNLHSYYSEPVILPPINPDNEANGVPSDHNGVFAKPSPSSNSIQTNPKIKKFIRPLPQSLIDNFGQQLQELDLNFDPHMNTDEMVSLFQSKLNSLVTEVFPLNLS